MNKTQFWAALGGPYSRKTANNFVEKLQALALDDLYQFEMIWMGFYQHPNYYDIVMQACQIFAGVDDNEDEELGLEEVEEKRLKCWLIAQGETVYNAVMQNPTNLRRYVPAKSEEFYLEINSDDLRDAPKLALQKKTGTKDYQGRNPWRTSTYVFDRDEFTNTSQLNAKKMGPHSPWVRKILRATDSSDQYGPAVGKILEEFLKQER